MIQGVEPNVAGGGLAHALAIVKSRLQGGMAHANLFFVPEGKAGPTSTAVGALLCECLRREFRVLTLDVIVPPPGETGEAAEYLCIAIDSTQPERVRDAIKERLWWTRPEARTQARLDDILQGRHGKSRREFRLEEYGIFVPCKTRKFAGIRTHSFQHRPAFYRYRVALTRVARMPEPMAEYLHELFTNCPNHLFSATVLRASGVGRRGLGVEIPLTKAEDHGIVPLAGRSRGLGGFSSRHENLQKFFLDHDPLTVENRPRSSS
jgi:hypothetical protein